MTESGQTVVITRGISSTREESNHDREIFWRRLQDPSRYNLPVRSCFQPLSVLWDTRCRGVFMTRWCSDTMAPGPIRTRIALRRHAKEGRSQDVRFRTRKTTSQEGDAAKIWRDSMSEVPASRQPGRPGTAPGSGESPVITDNMSNHTPSANKANVQQRRQKRQASNSPPTAKARARKRTAEQEQRSRSAKQSGKTPIGNPVIRQRKTLQAETKVPLGPLSLSQSKNREVPGDTSVEEPISEVQSNSETGEGASEQIPPVSYPASGRSPPLAGSDILATADNSEEEPVCLGSSFSFSDTGSMESRGLPQEGSHGQPAKVADQASKSRYGPDQASPSGPTPNPREKANEEPLEERIARIISQTPLEERITRIVRQAMQEIGGSGPYRPVRARRRVYLCRKVLRR